MNQDQDARILVGQEDQLPFVFRNGYFVKTDLGYLPIQLQPTVSVIDCPECTYFISATGRYYKVEKCFPCRVRYAYRSTDKSLLEIESRIRKAFLG